jgi:hypothetical protein
MNQRTSYEMAVLQIEVDIRLALQNDSKTIVVDGEGRLLPHQQAEHRMVNANDGKLSIEKDIIADLCKMWLKDVTHAGCIHQSGLSVHILSFFCAKIIFFSDIALYFCINPTKRTFSHAER